MKRLCVIYNFPQKYRSAIFKLIDKEWDSDWYFGDNRTDIRGFDLSILKSTKEIKNIKLLGPLTYQIGIPSLLFRKTYDTYLMLGDLNCLSTWIILLLHKCINRKKKIYLWSHGWYGREGVIKKFLKRIFFGASDGVFLYGQYAKECMSLEGFDSTRLFVIHNSLDYEEQKRLRLKMDNTTVYRDHFNNKNPNIIFIGRLTKVKRIDLLIESVASLAEEGFNVNVTLVGDGTERDKLELLAKERNVIDRVWFYGACYDDSRNSELIYNADLCVAPGNVGLTAMHTMAFGTPVLTHNNFPMQMPEFEAICAGKTGDFFNYDDLDSLTDQIKAWLQKHGKEREEIRKQCIDVIEDSWNPDYQINVLKENLK